MEPERERAEELEQMIEVLRGCKEGREVQCKAKTGDDKWYTSRHPWFDFYNFHYRLKPEPRRFWILAYSGIRSLLTPASITTATVHTSLHDALEKRACIGGEIIEVVEVESK